MFAIRAPDKCNPLQVGILGNEVAFERDDPLSLPSLVKLVSFTY
jgi:hypothetical protein